MPIPTKCRTYEDGNYYLQCDHASASLSRNDTAPAGTVKMQFLTAQTGCSPQPYRPRRWKL
jgi:hypothetical protein